MKIIKQKNLLKNVSRRLAGLAFALLLLPSAVVASSQTWIVSRTAIGPKIIPGNTGGLITPDAAKFSTDTTFFLFRENYQIASFKAS